MASTKLFLRLLPCLMLVACGSPASEGQLPVPSGAAAPAKAATAKAVHNAAAPAPATTAPLGSGGVVIIPGQMREEDTTHSVCTQPSKGGAWNCVTGDLKTSVNPDGCSADGAYGLVHADGEAAVTLQSSYPPFITVPMVKLREGQFVCITADVRKPVGERLWLYVTAIPPEAIPACNGRKVCGERGIPPVEWIGAAPKGQCRIEHGHFVDCAAGWISTSAVEEFSNGL